MKPYKITFYHSVQSYTTIVAPDELSAREGVQKLLEDYNQLKDVEIAEVEEITKDDFKERVLN